MPDFWLIDFDATLKGANASTLSPAAGRKATGASPFAGQHHHVAATIPALPCLALPCHAALEQARSHRLRCMLQHSIHP